MAKTVDTKKFWSADGLHHASLLRIWGFTCNNVASTMYLYLMAYSSYYLIGFVGMAVVLASSFATIMRVWDGVTDPIIGYLVDHTKGKFGKNRPYMVLGNLGMVIITYIMFHVTHTLPEGSIRVIFFVVLSIIYYIFFTFQNTITRAGQACLTNDPNERPKYAMFDGLDILAEQVFFSVFISSYLVPKYGTFYSTGLFHELWVACTIIAIICTVIAVIAIAPKDRPEFYGISSNQKVQWKDYFDVIKHNKAIQMLIVSASTDKLALQARGNATIGVVLYGVIVGNYALSGGMTMYSNVAAAAFCLVGAGFIATKFGQKKALVWASIGALIFNCAGFALWMLGDPTTLNLPGYAGFTGLTFFTVCFFIINVMINGFGSISGNIVLPMIADCSDYEVYRSGKFIPGMMGTLFSFVDKVFSSLAPTIVGLCYAGIGFTSALPDVSTPYTPALKYVTLFIMYGLPIIGLLFNLVAMKYYPLDKAKMAEIQTTIAEIKEKEKQAAINNCPRPAEATAAPAGTDTE